MLSLKAMEELDTAGFLKILKQKFPHAPTVKQGLALEMLARFVMEGKRDKVFLLKGFAGTGKTTLVSTLVGCLWKAKRSAVLMAPTGRAAKVMSVYSGNQAFTIHKKIYFPKKQAGGGIQFTLAPNKHRNTVFIVDEASMIPDSPSDSKLFKNGSLLDDLMFFVHSGHNCRLVLIGDTAQLPPVKLDLSPALDADRLALNYGKEVDLLELDQVMRQEEGSGILHNATNLREQLQSQYYGDFKFELAPFKDI